VKKKSNPEKSFDRRMRPPRQNPFFLPFIWLACFLVTKFRRLRVTRVNMKGLKPPYLVLSTHHGFIDFYVGPAVLFPHRANYISELEGFVGKEWLYRQVGCLCKRKFTTDIALIRNIQHVVHNNRDIMVIYPEARYCNVGTNSRLPESVGKLAKLLGIPVVILNMRGNYLLAPIWNLRKRRVRLEADLTQILTAGQTARLSVEEINARIAEHFVYNDYAWQREKGIRISYKKRAEGLHKALYLCPHCGAEYYTNTKEALLFCEGCGKEWAMTEYGEMRALEGETEFAHIPHWYEYQRDMVAREIAENRYCTAIPVRVEALPNARGFIDLGEGALLHNADGYRLEYRENGEEKLLCVKPIETTSVHTEYDYRGKGPCITLSTLDNTYFIYPLVREFNVTKVQFATEELYRLAHEQKKGSGLRARR